MSLVDNTLLIVTVAMGLDRLDSVMLRTLFAVELVGASGPTEISDSVAAQRAALANDSAIAEKAPLVVLVL